MYNNLKNKDYNLKDLSNIKVKSNILDNFLTVKDMEKVNKFGTIFHYMKECGKMIWQMVKED